VQNRGGATGFRQHHSLPYWGWYSGNELMLSHLCSWCAVYCAKLWFPVKWGALTTAQLLW
jgi:hypothetical protein